MGIMEHIWNRGWKGHKWCGRTRTVCSCTRQRVHASISAAIPPFPVQRQHLSKIRTLQLAENPHHSVFASEAAKTRDAKRGGEAWWSPWANPARAVASALRPPAPGTPLGPLWGQTWCYLPGWARGTPGTGAALAAELISYELATSATLLQEFSRDTPQAPVLAPEVSGSGITPNKTVQPLSVCKSSCSLRTLY